MLLTFSSIIKTNHYIASCINCRWLRIFDHKGNAHRACIKHEDMTGHTTKIE